MATLASLVIGIGADPAALRSGLLESQQIIRRFAQATQGAATSLQLFPNADKQASDAARAAVQGFQTQFNRDMALAKQRLAQGAISVSQFRILGASAGNAFDAALSAELSKLEAAGKLTDELRVELTKNFKSLGQSAGDVLKEEVEKKLRAIDTGSLAQMGQNMTRIGQRLTTTVTAPLVALGGLSAKIAADAQESANKFQAVFGPAFQNANREVQKLRRTIPATSAELQDMAAELQGLLVPMGIAPDAASKMSLSLVELAGDLSSFNNVALTGTEGALRKIRSGLIGESEPLRAFGVNLTEAALKAEALRQGFQLQGTQLTAAQKALSAYNIILRSTAIAQGDAARTANSAANTFKFLARDLREAGLIIGRELLPVIVPVARQLGGLLQTLNGLNPAIVKTGIAAAALAAAFGPLLRVVGGLVGTVVSLQKAITVLISRVAMGGLAALVTPGGLLVAGLVAIAGAFALGAYQAGRAARETEAFRTSLAGLTQVQLSLRMGGMLDEIQKAETKLANLQNQMRALGQDPQAAGLRSDLANRIDEVTESLTRMRGQMGAIGQQFHENQRVIDQTTEDAKRFQAALDQINKAGATPTSTKFKTITDQLKAQSDIILDLMKAQEERQIRVNGLAEALVSTYHRADIELSKLKDPLSDQARDLQKILTDLNNAIVGKDKPLQVRITPVIDRKALPKLPPLILETALKPPPVNEFRDFQVAIERAIQAENALKLARLSATPEERIRLEKSLADNLTAVTIAQKALASSVQRGTANFEEQARAVAVIEEGMAKLARQTEKTKNVTQQIAGALRAVTGLTRGVIGVADAMGRIGDEARDSLNNVVNLLGAIEDLTTSMATGNLFSIATSGIGVLGAVTQLFAGLNRASEEEMRAREEALQQQARVVESLARMRDAIDGFTDTIRSRIAAITVIRLGAGQPDIPGRASQSFLEFIRDLARDQVNVLNKPSGFSQMDAILRQFGTSLTQLIKYADEFGLTLFTNAGVPIPQAFEALAAQLAFAAEASTKFGNTLSDLRQKAELEANVFNLPDTATRAIQQGLDQMGKLAPDLFREFFAGVNLSDQKAVEAALQRLTRAFLDNELDWKKFGDLFGKDDLIQIIEQVAGGLDRMREATDEVTESLLGLPSGYKIAKARFDATVAETAQTLSRVLNRINAPGAISPPLRAADIPSPSTVREVTGDASGVTQAVFVFRDGAIKIDARDRTASEMFDEVKVEAQRRARQLGPNRPASDALDT